CSPSSRTGSFNGAATDRSRKSKERTRHHGPRSCFNGAATDRSRKSTNSVRSIGLMTASMGPRPIGRGNTPPAPSRYIRNMLQWGRDRSVAEILQSPEDELCSLFASMGPRPIGRGNSNSRVRQKHGGSLQWGRDRSVAEIHPPPPPPAKNDVFI